MRLVCWTALDQSLSSIAVSADGTRVAVLAGASPRYLPRTRPDATPAVHLYRANGEALEREASLPLDFPAQRLRSQGSRLRVEDGKVAFLDEQTLLVASRAVMGFTDEEVTLLALDLNTGAERGRWVWPTFLQSIPADIIPLPPRHALLSVRENVVCVNVEMFQEVCRARQVTEDHDVDEEDASPEEQVAQNGLAHDAVTGRTHLLCRAHGEAILLTCRLDLSAQAFVRESRHVFPEKQDRVGLCLTPGGGLTAVLQVADDWVNLSGSTVVWDEDTRARLLTQPRPPSPPRTTRLGSLLLIPPELGGESESVDFSSDFMRDFEAEDWTITDGGESVHIGYRLTSGSTRLTLAHGDFLTKPVYISNVQAVVGSPSGVLLGVNTETKQSEPLHDFRARINSLQFCPARQRLFGGGEDGLLTVISVQ